MALKLPAPGGLEYELEEPARGQFPSTLGGAVEYTFTHFIYSVLRVMGKGIGTFGASILVGFLGAIEPELVSITAPLITYLRDLPDMPDELKGFFGKLAEPKGQAASAVLSTLGGAAGGAVVYSLVDVLLSPVTYGLSHKIRPSRPGPAEAWAMRWREGIDEPTLRDWLADVGWPESAIDAFASVLRPRASVGDLIAWAWRIHQDPEVIKGELTKRGFLDEDIDKYMELAHLIPGPSDLVRFALREAWRDDIAAKYGYDEDWVGQFGEWMEKQGYSPDWAHKYWRAHWLVPSARMGFEMLHRKVIDKGELDDLLRVADIPRFWRDALLKISYMPYTRVDVRRMHKIGVLGDDDLVTTYEDLGYDHEHALKMAEFTIRYNIETEMDYTKAEVLKGYNLGMLSAEDAIALFVELGKSEEYARYLLELEDYKRAWALVNEEVKNIRLLYINMEIDETQTHARLGKLGLAGARVARYLEEWGITRRAKIARPSRAMLEEFYKDGTITEDVAREELRKRRYQARHIDWILTDWNQQMVEDRRKEAERAQKEQERITKAEFRTKRAVALANLNAEIAELRLMVAELKVAKFFAITDEQREACNRGILEARKEIAALQLEKAELPVTAE